MIVKCASTKKELFMQRLYFQSLEVEEKEKAGVIIPDTFNWWTMRDDIEIQGAKVEGYTVFARQYPDGRITISKSTILFWAEMIMKDLI